MSIEQPSMVAAKAKKQKDFTGISVVQMDAEIEIRKILRDHLQINEELQPKRIALEGEIYVKVDAATADDTVLIEIFARQGKLLDGQKKKLAKDILKLAVLKQRLPNAVVILAFSNASVKRHLSTQSWVSMAIRDIGIDLINLEEQMPQQLKAKIRAAQTKQAENRKR